ncbi:hypothetical protein BGW38_001252, partial [Lunasporangiospora selenospora]
MEEETLSFRLVETTEITEISLHHRTDGEFIVHWEDIERAFPGVTPVRNGISTIKFLRGSDYQSIKQCAQSMDVVLSTSVQSVPQKSGPVGGQTNVPIGATLPLSGMSASNTDPLDTSPTPGSGTIASSKTVSFKQIVTKASRKAREAEIEQRFISPLAPEIQEILRASPNIYHSFAMFLKDGQREQELNRRFQKFEDILVKNSKLQEEMYAKQEEVNRLQKEMSANLEVMKQLEEQVLDNQEEMKEMQQRTLNQIGVLHSRVQAILTQTYELHEYPIPRLFVVLPQDPS